MNRVSNSLTYVYLQGFICHSNGCRWSQHLSYRTWKYRQTATI